MSNSNKFLFKKPGKIKEFRHLVSFEKNHTWGVDLIDYSSENGPNHGYVFVAIDYFTRYLWARILKSKTKKSIHDAFVDICQNDAGFYPDFIHSDREAGLINDENLPHSTVYHTDNLYSKGSSPIVERVIRTIREKLEQKRSETNGRNWKVHLNDVLEEYNQSKHRTIKMAPKDAIKDENKGQVLALQHNLNRENKTEQPAKLSVGDKVLDLKEQNIFAKGFKSKWNRTILTIIRVDTGTPTVYICDNGKKYYYEQLNKLTADQVRYLNKEK